MSGKSLSAKLCDYPSLSRLLIVIPLLFIGICLGIPLCNILSRSLMGPDGFTLSWFIKIFTEPLYLRVLWATLKISFMVTVLCLVLAYPIAYLSVTDKSDLVRRLITAGILIPYWISMLVRIFAWQVLMQSNGLINQIMMFLGIFSEPAQILYTEAAVCVSLTHILIPFMYLSLQANMSHIDLNLLNAAKSMGANKRVAFLTVFLPLSREGMISGSILVFVLALGFYIAPALLGGPNNMMLSNLIEINMNSFNWPLAAALAFELLVLVLAIVFVTFKTVGNIFIRK